MKHLSLYIDSAHRPAVETLLTTGLFDGVTTNPTLLARAGLTQADLPAVHRWATAAGARRVYLQTLGTTVADIVDSGRRLRELGDDVIVKIPATRAGLAATRVLADAQVPVLLTAVYHAAQALPAVAAGAHSIAPYVGRMTDQGRDGVRQTTDMQRILAGTGTGILAASVRTVDDVTALATAGIEDFTLNPDLLERLLADPLTDAAADAFEHAMSPPAP